MCFLFLLVWHLSCKYILEVYTPIH
uniref:Uncharacterized protein n=1 Tax=Arundo donax TaxID=35708 RepID=A0A0A9AHS8_ARUDO